MHKHLLLLLCILLPGAWLYAQDKTNITGQVTTSDGQPAPAVKVVIKNSHRNATTNESGNFIFRNVEAGHYELEISLSGYQPVTQEVTVEKGQRAHVNIALSIPVKALQAVIITGNKQRLTRISSEYVAKMPLKNIENPQVYTSVTKELLQEQMVVSYADAIKNIPGVVMQLENNSAGGTVTSRGFSTQSFLRNGIPGNIGGGTVDPANIETLEAIKGPSGTLYGSSFVSFGGLFNRVTKKPFDHFKGEVAYTVGSYGLSRFTADVNTPLNKEKTLLFRLNAAKHNEGSFQDAGFKNYVFLAPTLTYKVDDKTTLTVDAEYRNEKGNSFYRMFADGSYATGVRSPKDLKIDFRKRFSGDDITTANTAANLYLTLDHQLSGQWSSHTNFTYLSSTANGLSGYLSMKPGNDSLIRNMNYTEYSNANAIDFQQNFNGDFRIGHMRNRLVAGIDIYSVTTKSSGAPTLPFDVISASKPGAAYTQLTKLALLDRFKGMAYTKSIAQQNIYSAYLQDVLNITDRFLVMASVRIDRFDNRGTKNITRDTTTGKYAQTAVSPKFGLVYQIVKDQLSVFANYMNGFQNIAPVQQPDGTFSSFKPSQANQFEGGFKANLLNGKLNGSISYYQINVKDITRMDVPDRPTYTVQNGTQYSKGIEAEITATPARGFNIIAGYAYNDSKIEKSNPTLDGFRPISAGPANTVNTWLSYRLYSGALKGLGLGVGGNYASDNKVILSTTSEYALPAYTIVNAGISYDKPRFAIAFKVNNISNQEYWVGWSTTIPQMPRNFNGSVALKF
ncbi:TonB-dependent receptor [Chitinophaga arvensicola]|uniref:Iron complex outermembrane recepter protein n=1 Tax=Chitinophaga arvensicola TaxID=29529 RepID=A0A1I0R9A9_9BACT|nr:TonB-dependent receptor [Chitinophaga arvensicola]SEW36772.1 iron complex outermembrane recepter protein [Chitinophaga arvensicola]